MKLNRRQFLKLSAAGAALAALPLTSLPGATLPPARTPVPPMGHVPVVPETKHVGHLNLGKFKKGQHVLSFYWKDTKDAEWWRHVNVIEVEDDMDVIVELPGTDGYLGGIQLERCVDKPLFTRAASTNELSYSDSVRRVENLMKY